MTTFYAKIKTGSNIIIIITKNFFISYFFIWKCNQKTIISFENDNVPYTVVVYLVGHMMSIDLNAFIKDKKKMNAVAELENKRFEILIHTHTTRQRSDQINKDFFNDNEGEKIK